MSGSWDRLNCEILQGDSTLDPRICLVPRLLPLSGARLPGGYETFFLTSWVRADGFVGRLDSDLGEALF